MTERLNGRMATVGKPINRTLEMRTFCDTSHSRMPPLGSMKEAVLRDVWEIRSRAHPNDLA